MHFLLKCPAYAASRAEMIACLLPILPDCDDKIKSNSRKKLLEFTEILLFGTKNTEKDKKIFSAVAKFIKKSERFIQKYSFISAMLTIVSIKGDHNNN